MYVLVPQDRLQLTAYHPRDIQAFLNQIVPVLRKYRIQLPYRGQDLRRQKETILRSPHVNKTARDQIERQAVTFTYCIRSPYTRFYLSLLQAYLRAPFQTRTTRVWSQRLFHVLSTS